MVKETSTSRHTPFTQKFVIPLQTTRPRTLFRRSVRPDQQTREVNATITTSPSLQTGFP